MKICRFCKFYLGCGYCGNPDNVLEENDFVVSPVSGDKYSVSCEIYNQCGRCERYEKGWNIEVPLPVWMLLSIVTVIFIIFMVGVSVGQHI